MSKAAVNRILAMVLAIGLLTMGCGKETAGEVAETTPGSSSSSPSPSSESPLDTWWQQVSELCGKAYAGALVTVDPADAELAGKPMTMHVRKCDAKRLEIPFHIGENRSRTWVLTRTETGIQLQHDHRHEDGSEDTVTLYGGHTQTPGTATVQDFPVDSYSKELFEANGLTASVTNVWTMEIVPGGRFSYILRRPGRHFQVDFNLGVEIAPPPPAWGHE